jgi:acetyl esterase/lipase
MRKTIASLLLAAPLLAQPMPPFASYPENLVPTFANETYAPVSSSHKLDIFLPHGDGPFPLVLNIHGGAFMFGSKEMLDVPVARALLEAGIAVASLNYRLSGEASFPAAVQDVKAAVRFLRANASRYNLDGRIIAFGQSAGGNLASLLGTSAGESLFEDPSLGHPDVSSNVQGVIDWFGPTDFLQMDAQAKSEGCPDSAQRHAMPDSPESRYLGAPISTVPERVRAANPIAYITPDDPPFLIQKGSGDCTVPVGQSQILADALKKAGVPAEFDLLEGAGHGDRDSSEPHFLSENNVERIVTFARSTFTK